MLSFYQFYPRQIITPNTNSAYFIRDFEAVHLCKTNCHNPEWYIQQKINENKEGYFDFSKNIIDIGACYGVYSVVLPFKHAFMFEPNKEYYAYCQANMLLHGKIYDADIFNVAVSNETGTIRFDGFNGADLANENGNAWTHTPCIDVPCIKLDDMQDKLTNIGFIKIDIEGMEPYAIISILDLSRLILKAWSRMPLWVRNTLSGTTTILLFYSKAGEKVQRRNHRSIVKNALHYSKKYWVI